MLNAPLHAGCIGPPTKHHGIVQETLLTSELRGDFRVRVRVLFRRKQPCNIMPRMIDCESGLLCQNLLPSNLPDELPVFDTT